LKKILSTTMIAILLVTIMTFANSAGAQINSISVLEGYTTRSYQPLDEDSKQLIEAVGIALDADNPELEMQALGFSLISTKTEYVEFMSVDEGFIATGRKILFEDNQILLYDKDAMQIIDDEISIMDASTGSKYSWITLSSSSYIQGGGSFGDSRVVLSYSFNLEGFGRIYNDAWAVSWDDTGAYVESTSYTSSLIYKTGSISGQGFEVPPTLYQGHFYAFLIPRDGFANAHGAMFQEFADVYGAPANWTFSIGKGFASIGYTTEGSVRKAYLRDTY